MVITDEEAGMARRNQRIVHAVMAIVLGTLAMSAAVGHPLVDAATAWLSMAVVAMAWLIVTVVRSRRGSRQ